MLRNALYSSSPLRSPDVGAKRLMQSSTTCHSSLSVHSSLASFLVHARNTGLSSKSSLYTGTLYEYLCLETLSSPAYGFSLTRIGQRNDAGIDLIGEWKPPVSLSKTSIKTETDIVHDFPFPLRVLIQCKSSRNKLSPNVVRELEGCVAGAPAGWKGSNTLAILCAKKEASKGVRDAVRDAGMGVVWVLIEEGEGGATLGESEGLSQGGGDAGGAVENDGIMEEQRSLDETKHTRIPVGRVRQMLWNQRAANVGLEAVKVGMKYVRKKAGGEMDREVQLLGI